MFALTKHFVIQFTKWFEACILRLLSVINTFTQTEVELQKATVKFQRANSLYKAAKETVSLAEERMNEKTSDDASKPEFDSAWQEMMNHATLRVLLLHITLRLEVWRYLVMYLLVLCSIYKVAVML